MVRRGAPPLNDRSLRDLAIRYVARYATSSGKLERYLARKISERGWEGDSPPATTALVEECITRGYVDNVQFARIRAAGLARKGLGRIRIGIDLRNAGVPENIAIETLDHQVSSSDVALVSAIRLARRKRIGPYGSGGSDPAVRKRWMGQLARAGHSGETVRRLLALDADAADALAESAPING